MTAFDRNRAVSGFTETNRIMAATANKVVKSNAHRSLIADTLPAINDADR